MRELSLRLLIAFVLCIGFGIAFGYIASAIGNESIASFDTAVIGFVQGLEAPWLTTVMKVFTWIGSGYVVAPIALIGFIVLYFVLHYRQQAFLLIVVIAGSVIFNSVLKNYFKRERPEIHRILDANGFSFPSGHSMMAFALYAIIAYIAWRNVTTMTSRVVLVAIHRLYDHHNWSESHLPRCPLPKRYCRGIRSKRTVGNNCNYGLRLFPEQT